MRMHRFLFAASAASIIVAAAPASAQTDSSIPGSIDPVDEDERLESEAEAVDIRDADGTPTTGNTIVVTGSRIRRPEAISNEPVTVLDETYIEDRNITNVADALNELPIYRGSVTPNGAQGSFGQGVNFANNYGLGSNRTLTLINGRRFVSSNVPSLFNNASQGTQVDLNIFPTILIERVDTVAVGGAPVYGSDAIAGTLNLILKNRFQGLEARVLSGVTEQGDNFRYNASVAGGLNFADGRGNITLAVSRDEVKGVLSRQRDFNLDNVETQPNIFGPGAPQRDFIVNPNFPVDAGDTDGVPPRVRFRGITLPFLDRGGVIFGGPLSLSRSFAPNGDLVPFDSGFATEGIRAVGGDGFRFSDFSQITSDLERTSVNAFANFDILPNLTVYAEGTYFKSTANELVQQPSFNTPLFGGASGAVTYLATNPFLTAQARGVLAANNVTSFRTSRVSLDLSDPSGFGENEVFRGVAGFRGTFDALGTVFNFDASINKGRAEITTFSQDINRQNFINAISVTRNANGDIVCTADPNLATASAPGGSPIADPSCVPLNLLGEGRASQAALDYVIQDNEALAVLEQTVYNVNIGASLFDLYGAGAIGFNIGYEHRDEEGGFTPSEFQQQGLGRSVAIGPVNGKFNVDEVFGEVLIPLVGRQNNVPFIYEAEVFGRGRYVDNTVNGGFFSWAAGGSISPVPDIKFRGNFTRSFRAPAITELFQPVSSAFATVAFPCQNANAGPNPDIRQANCDAFFAQFPNALLDPSISATIPVLSGGNVNLENETADSYTFGVVLQPSFLRRFTMTVDYTNIKIQDPITSLSATDIAFACFDNPNFDAGNPANGNNFCSQIRRQPAGSRGPDPRDPNAPQIDTGGFVINDPANPGVQSGFVNGEELSFEGIQGTLNYDLPESLFGIPGYFGVGGSALYVISRVNNETGVDDTPSDGLIGDPEFSAQLILRYTGEDLGTAVFVNYTGEQLFSTTTRGLDIREIDKLDDYVTVNASVYFDVADNFRFTLTATNLFDRQGEDYFGTLIGVNDALGRRFAASARVRF